MTRPNTNYRMALVAPTASDSIREAHSYEYDNNGNIVYVNTQRLKPDMTVQPDTVQRARQEHLRWDEENRLAALSQNGYVSHYWYDADGERDKRTVPVSHLDPANPNHCATVVQRSLEKAGINTKAHNVVSWNIYMKPLHTYTFPYFPSDAYQTIKINNTNGHEIKRHKKQHYIVYLVCTRCYMLFFIRPGHSSKDFFIFHMRNKYLIYDIQD